MPNGSRSESGNGFSEGQGRAGGADDGFIPKMSETGRPRNMGDPGDGAYDERGITMGTTELTAENPLVSIGVPVRNGAPYIDEALSLLINQTYKNIEIIISDNGSQDETAAICKKYTDADPRVVYCRQDTALTALENFRFVLERSTGMYFLWAAHDDRRSLNYVDALVKKGLANPTASLIFSEAAVFNDFENWRTAPALSSYAFACSLREGYWTNILNRRYILSGYLHIYGLILRQALVDYGWFEIEVGADRPLLFYLSCRGDFVKADGATFYCYKPVKKKSVAQRAKDTSGHTVRPFPRVRLACACGRAGALANVREGRLRRFWTTFMTFIAFECKTNVNRSLRKIICKFRNT